MIHLMYMGDIKLFAKNEKELETYKDSEDIQSRYRDGISKRKLCNTNNEKH